MSVLDTATYVLDTPGALLRGLLAGKPGSRATGREVLRLGENKPGFESGDIPAFLAEIVLDPLTWIGGAGIAIQGRPMLDYLKDPTEVMARVAQTRQGMEEAGIKALTPSRRSPGLLGTKRDKTARSFNTSVLELTDLPQNVRRYLNDLLKVYGPRLVNHMLRVLPAAAVTTGGAYAAANAMSPRQAVSA